MWKLSLISLLMIFALKLLHCHIFPILCLNTVFHSSLFMQLLRSVLISGFVTVLIGKILQFVISSFIFVFIIFWECMQFHGSVMPAKKVLSYHSTFLLVAAQPFISVSDRLLLENAVVIEPVRRIHGGSKLKVIMFVVMHVWQCPGSSSIVFFKAVSAHGQ